jgi:hypothetical protein
MAYRCQDVYLGTHSASLTAILGLVVRGFEFGFATRRGVQDEQDSRHYSECQDRSRQNRTSGEFLDQGSDKDRSDLLCDGMICEDNGRTTDWDGDDRGTEERSLTHCMAAFMPVRIPTFL